ncbi:hypothetical protein GCM10025865_18850 [Paraoerskovia sediminicola]|uniref:RAMA domain-containing protein n=1 Tax=Paraoerskovia sediminicola TaxID=1138587 RepID=A0ABM8G3J2_9CELL|nr:hypothetical protein [Paraoerskovia sediminicola]BDZ42586.1 hypothetical protein GCM10025865_18850 [Paraoerskovia sediminicola]
MDVSTLPDVRTGAGGYPTIDPPRPPAAPEQVAAPQSRDAEDDGPSGGPATTIAASTNAAPSSSTASTSAAPTGEVPMVDAPIDDRRPSGTPARDSWSSGTPAPDPWTTGAPSGAGLGDERRLDRSLGGSPVDASIPDATSAAEDAAWRSAFGADRADEVAAPTAARSSAAAGDADEDDSDLHALARSIGRPTELVWSRPRRGQRFEATLRTDGTIVLDDGTSYRSPDSAAVAVSGRFSAEGWAVWRIGDGGPTLTEEFRSRFS